jgi:hypothetical protein
MTLQPVFGCEDVFEGERHGGPLVGVGGVQKVAQPSGGAALLQCSVFGQRTARRV